MEGRPPCRPFVGQGRARPQPEVSPTRDRQFALQTCRRWGSFSDVRWVVTLFSAALILSSLAEAQDQERKLVDRLLKPDETLQNNAQNKKFGSAGRSVDKRATVGTFYLEQKSNSKSFSQTRDFSARQLSPHSFRGVNRHNLSAQNRIVNSETNYPTSSLHKVQDAHSGNKSADSRRFAEQRPFLDRGKSQKSLSRKNPPLTIEQVRELLNKNK